MLYLVECNFRDAAREADWNAWYNGHLADLLRIPGIASAQRLRALGGGFPTYRAMYAVESPGVFTSEAYLGRKLGRFPEAWRESVADWRRNLFAGIDAPPAVADDQCVVLATAEGATGGVALRWLDVVALDQSVQRLGIGVVSRADGERLVAQGITGLTVSAPLTPYCTSPAMAEGRPPG